MVSIKKTSNVLGIFFCFFFFAVAADAVELTLKDAVSAALKENLSLAEQALLVEASRADITGAEGEFDPALNFDAANRFEKAGTLSLLSGPETETFGYGVSFGGKVKTGTSYELKWASEKVRRSDTPYLLINPYYSSSLQATVKQPILKGFGFSVQKSRIDSAKGALEMSKLKAGQSAMEIINDTVKSYWDLYFSRENVKVAELSYALAESLLKEMEAKIKTGELAPVEIFKAEAELALRNERLLGARKAVLDAEDALRTIMNVDDWQDPVVPLDIPPGPSGPVPELKEVMDSALNSRPEYLSADEELKTRKIMSSFYRNQRLPDLSLNAAAGVMGLNDGYGGALEGTTSGDFYSWQAGVTLSIPLGGRTDKGNYLRAKREEEMAGLKIKTIRQRITAEVREAVRALTLAVETIKATGATRAASQKRLDAEEARFKLGMATTNDVLQFQQEYTDALASEKKALTDYEIALAALKKASGQLFEKTASGVIP